MKNTNTKFLFLSGILTSLILIFLLTFINAGSESKRHNVTTALLNPKYKLSKISFSTKDEITVLHNCDDFWGGEYFDGNETIYFPVDEYKISEFIEKSREIISLEKVLDAKTKEQFEYYSLDENAITVTYYDDQDNPVSTIHFGAMNQSLDKIFLWSEKNMTIYSMDSRISYYLDSEIKFWTDQNIIPQGISKSLNASTIQNMSYQYKDADKTKVSDKLLMKFPSLRFSEIVESFEASEKELSIEIIDGSGTAFTYNFFPAKTKNGDCYVFNLNIKPSIVYSAKQKDFIRKLNYYSSISQWTYKTITELLQ